MGENLPSSSFLNRMTYQHLELSRDGTASVKFTPRLGAEFGRGAFHYSCLELTAG